jgi:hypothetical protein
MSYIKLFEDYSRIGPYSSWPKQPHSKGVKIIRTLDPKDDEDLEEIKKEVESAFQRKNWFTGWVTNGKAEIPKYTEVFFAEVLRPDGKAEILFFDEFFPGDDGMGTVGAETQDGKYEFWLNATGNVHGDYEIDIPFEMDWDRKGPQGMLK